jgi:integrase
MARRRANGQGTVYLRKDGRWEGAGYVLVADGGTRRVRVYAATRDEAQARLDTALGQSAKGVPVGGATVAAFITTWLNTVAVHRLRPTTFETYRHYVHAFIIPGLGGKLVHQLTSRDVREWINTVRGKCQCCAQGWDAKRDLSNPRRERRPRCCAIGKCCGRRVTDGTIAYLRVILSSALAHAMREDELSRNVASAVQLGPIRGRLFEPFTAEEARQFLATIQHDQWQTLFGLALRTGLRRGELLGLKWTDLDPDGATLTVTRTLQHTRDGPRLLPTKTVGSQRRILLSHAVLASLAQHRKRQHAQAQAHGPGFNPHGLVFTTESGQPVADPGSINKHLTAACIKAGIRRIRFHDLRHSCATLLLEQGVELITIKELLGHTQIHTTADIYAHVRLRLHQEAPDALGRALHDDRKPDGPSDDGGPATA